MRPRHWPVSLQGMFDLAVIGTGIMGAPTVWHAQRSGAYVVAIGVPEPAIPDRHSGLFGAWHDSSRLLWRHHADPADTELTRRSLEDIKSIEAECGDTFLTEVGFLFAADPGRDEGMRQFLDEKTYRPGLGQLDLKTARQRSNGAAKGKAKPKAKPKAKAKAKPKARARASA